ncbi:hypothetical protein A3G06_00635 [Candidatus Nomurabacteria bacterium RIFCSPLOWO2_12_FULL_46_14]|uniref:Response regulatory domain-containing protein n=1 Tax=Candidatus Nomurabacteria bacterium RIFCSPLOWO2_12_FULL_46_14 TaxID=1801797 RepID=A0A1F6Y8T4_9BACT|nr:MAG: hypothetical protein A3G06_00635 [Candidatus Nomurabacteria bacterium RIFCSPLOWO2_12_FULL_46_14]
MTEQQPPIPSVPANSPEENEQLNLRVLLAEDYAPTLAMSARALRRKGCTVFEAKNGQLALDQLKANPGGYDIVISDYNMPGKNGIELLTEIRNDDRLKNLPMLIVTGNTIQDGIDIDIKALGGTFLSKPYERKDYFAAIRRTVQGSAS